jgi:3-oxoacyl-[acyl-carrier protein] reductase
MRLEGKTALVTGAASGFGAAIVRRYAEEGARVVVADINGQGARETAQAIGSQARAVAADVTDAGDVKAMIGEAYDAFGRLDILVNNAGYTHRNTWMLDVDEAAFDRVFAVNVKAIFLSAREAVPRMIEQGGGVILVTASTAGLRPRPGLTWYNGSKGAAVILTKSMAVELAPHGIRVNCLCPVMGETGMLDDFIGGDSPEKRAKVVAGIPLGRLSKPLDVANAALFLASKEAEFLTGVALEVDGGRCI